MLNAQFVAVAYCGVHDPDVPDARVVRARCAGCFVPQIPVADNFDRPSIGSPRCKVRSGGSLTVCKMRPEVAMHLVVRAFTKEVEVEIRHDGVLGGWRVSTGHH